MLRLSLSLIPAALLGGCLGSDDPSWRMNFTAHFATSWTTTERGITRDAGPFGSVEAGYTSDAEIDAALDANRADFIARFPEYSWINPLVHLTDDYSFWVSSRQSWASGMAGDGEIFLALWTRVVTEAEPTGDFWIKRHPDTSDGAYVWRHTGVASSPAYQHECLHLAIGDPLHTSSLWDRLR